MENTFPTEKRAFIIIKNTIHHLRQMSKASTLFTTQKQNAIEQHITPDQKRVEIV